jgi:hypothetical protein
MASRDFGAIVEMGTGAVEMVKLTRWWGEVGSEDVVYLTITFIEGGTVIKVMEPLSNWCTWFAAGAMSDEKVIIGFGCGGRGCVRGVIIKVGIIPAERIKLFDIHTTEMISSVIGEIIGIDVSVRM